MPQRLCAPRSAAFDCAGAVAILGRDATRAEFEAAVHGKDIHFNQWLTRTHLQRAVRKQKETPPLPLVLVAREKEVLCLLCEEKSNKEIAGILCVSKRTVEGIRRTLMQKTKSDTAAGLVKFAFRNGLCK